MKLATVLSIQGGGPGSGPNAPCPQCGPHGGKETEESRRISQSDRERLRSTQPGPKTSKDVGNIRVPRKLDSPGRRLYEKYRERQGKATKMPAVRQTMPKPKAHPFEPGDKAVLKKETVGYDDKKMRSTKYPIGREVKVVRILEDTGVIPRHIPATVTEDKRNAPGKTQDARYVNEAVIVVSPGRGHTLLKVPASELQLLKKSEENAPKIENEPIRPSRVRTQYTTPDGARVTVLNPKADDDRELSSRAHPQKGEFKAVSGLVQNIVNPAQKTQVYFAQSPTGKETEDALRGTTVFVHRFLDTRQAIIEEVKTLANAERSGTRWREYKSIGAANNFLRERYGIRQQLPRWGGTTTPPAPTRRRS